MQHDEDPSPDVDQFLLDQIDTVPHLEALLLMWNSRPKSWSVEEMARSLFLEAETAKAILEDLVQLRLVTMTRSTPPGESYHYNSEPNRDRLVAAVETTYRRELIRISRLIHSKPSAAIRAFARAFRLKKDRD